MSILSCIFVKFYKKLKYALLFIVFFYFILINNNLMDNYIIDCYVVLLDEVQNHISNEYDFVQKFISRDYNKLIKYYTSLLDKTVLCIDYLNKLIKLSKNTKDYKSVFMYGDSVLKMNEHKIDFIKLLAKFYETIKDYNVSIVYYEALHKNYKFDLTFNDKINHLQKIINNNTIINKYKIDIQNGNIYAMEKLACLYEDLNDIDNAVIYYKMAVDNNHSKAKAQYCLTSLLKKHYHEILRNDKYNFATKELALQFIKECECECECPICFELNNLMITKCNHQICTTCFSKIFNENKTPLCPLCRSSL